MQGAIGVSGPVVAMWFQGYRLSKNAFVFSVTLVFLVSGAAQALLLAGAGEYDRDRLVAVALALVVVHLLPEGDLWKALAYLISTLALAGVAGLIVWRATR